MNDYAGDLSEQVSGLISNYFRNLKERLFYLAGNVTDQFDKYFKVPCIGRRF